MKETTLYATDVHGDMEFYARLFEQAKESKAKYLIIGGDITPLEFLQSPVGFQGQRDFLEQELMPLIKQLHQETGITVFTLLGNDDYSINTDILEEAEDEGFLKFIHNRVHPIGKYMIAG